MRETRAYDRSLRLGRDETAGLLGWAIDLPGCALHASGVMRKWLGLVCGGRPLLMAMVYRLALGGWQLVVLAGMVSIVSERKRLAELTRLPFDRWSLWIPPLFLFTYWGLLANPVGALAILSFWFAWELHCWGGADAVATIALVLVWPEMAFVVALLGVHLVVALGLTGYSLVCERRFRMHTLPGLPLIFATVLAFLTFQGLSGWPI